MAMTVDQVLAEYFKTLSFAQKSACVRILSSLPAEFPVVALRECCEWFDSVSDASVRALQSAVHADHEIMQQPPADLHNLGLRYVPLFTRRTCCALCDDGRIGWDCPQTFTCDGERTRFDSRVKSEIRSKPYADVTYHATTNGRPTTSPAKCIRQFCTNNSKPKI